MARKSMRCYRKLLRQLELVIAQAIISSVYIFSSDIVY